MRNWFEVDKEGLSKLLERRGKVWVLHELLQNAWDQTDATWVSVSLEPVPGRPLARLKVEDNSAEGFRDLSHAFTLFAESCKKGNAGQRGRWNLGEKLVLALCEDASIRSTKGTVYFNPDGRTETQERTGRGSVFSATLRMTRAELETALLEVRRVLPPMGYLTTVNGEELETPAALLTRFEATLPTVFPDGEGRLRPTRRKTWVEIHPLGEGEEPYLYELGIPVCTLEAGERWSANVLQKVPLSLERDSVSAGYLRTLRVHVLNAIPDRLEEGDVTEGWVRDAAADPRVEEEAFTRTVSLRFGDKRVIADPSDPEGEKIAKSEGYTVMTGGSLSAGEWENVRRYEAALPAGRVTPSPRAYGESGPPAKVIGEADWTPQERVVLRYAKRLTEALLDAPVWVKLVEVPRNQFLAAWCEGRELHLNRRAFGVKFFRETALALEDADFGALEELNETLLHEAAHEYSGDHLSAEYHGAICRLGAKLGTLALTHPGLFLGEEERWKSSIG